MHGRTDGGSNTASPTTPPYPYIFYLAMYFRTDRWSNTASPTTPFCLHTFHNIESTLKGTLSLCCRYFLRLGLKYADHHILMSCTTLFYFSPLQLAYRVKFLTRLSKALLLRFLCVDRLTAKLCNVSFYFFYIMPHFAYLEFISCTAFKMLTYTPLLRVVSDHLNVAITPPPLHYNADPF